MTESIVKGTTATALPLPVASPGWNRILLNTSDSSSIVNNNDTPYLISSSTPPTTDHQSLPHSSNGTNNPVVMNGNGNGHYYARQTNASVTDDDDTVASVLSNNPSLVKTVFASRATSSGILHIAQATLNLQRAAEDIAHRARVSAHELELTSPFQRKNYDYPHVISSPTKPFSSSSSSSTSSLVSPPPPPLPSVVKDFTVNLPPAGLSKTILQNKYFQQLVQPHPELLQNIQIGDRTAKLPPTVPHSQQSTVSHQQKVVQRLSFPPSSNASSTSSSPGKQNIPHQNVVAVNPDTLNTGLLLSKNDFETIAHLASNLLQADQKYDIPAAVLEEPTYSDQSISHSPPVKLQGKIIDNKLVIHTVTPSATSIPPDQYHNNNNNHGQRIYLTGYVPRSQVGQDGENGNSNNNKENETTREIPSKGDKKSNLPEGNNYTTEKETITTSSSTTVMNESTLQQNGTTNNTVTVGPNRKVPVYLTDYNELREQDRQQQQQQLIENSSSRSRAHQKPPSSSSSRSRSRSQSSVRSTVSSNPNQGNDKQKDTIIKPVDTNTSTKHSSPSIVPSSITTDDKDETSSLPPEIDDELRNAANVLIQQTKGENTVVSVPQPVPPPVPPEGSKPSSSRIRSRTSSIGERIIPGNGTSETKDTLDNNNISSILGEDRNDHPTDNTVRSRSSSVDWMLADNNNYASLSSSALLLRGNDRRTWSTSAALEIHRRYKEYKKEFASSADKKAPHSNSNETDQIVPTEDAIQESSSSSLSVPHTSSSTQTDNVVSPNDQQPNSDDTAFTQALVHSSLQLQQQRLFDEQQLHQQSTNLNISNRSKNSRSKASSVVTSDEPSRTQPSMEQPAFAIVKPRTVDREWAMDHPHEIEQMIQESMLANDPLYPQHYEGSGNVPMIHASYTDIYSKQQHRYPNQPIPEVTNRTRSRSRSRSNIRSQPSKLSGTGTTAATTTNVSGSIGDYDYVRTFHSTGSKNATTTTTASSVWPTKRAAYAQEKIREQSYHNHNSSSSLPNHHKSRSKSPTKQTSFPITTLNPSNAIVPVPGYASFLSRQDAARKQRSQGNENSYAVLMNIQHSVVPPVPTKPVNIQLKTQERAKARLIGQIQLPLTKKSNDGGASPPPLVNEATNLYYRSENNTFSKPQSSSSSPPKSGTTTMPESEISSSNRYINVDDTTTEPLPMLPAVSLIPKNINPMNSSSHHIPPILNPSNRTVDNNNNSHHHYNRQNNLNDTVRSSNSGTTKSINTTTTTATTNVSVGYYDTVPPSSYSEPDPQYYLVDHQLSAHSYQQEYYSQRKLPVRKSSILASSVPSLATAVPSMSSTITQTVPVFQESLLSENYEDYTNQSHNREEQEEDLDPSTAKLYAAMAASNRSDLIKLGITTTLPRTANTMGNISMTTNSHHHRPGPVKNSPPRRHSLLVNNNNNPQQSMVSGTTSTTMSSTPNSTGTTTTVLDRLPYTAGLTMSSPPNRKKPNNNI